MQRSTIGVLTATAALFGTTAFISAHNSGRPVADASCENHCQHCPAGLSAVADKDSRPCCSDKQDTNARCHQPDLTQNSSSISADDSSPDVILTAAEPQQGGGPPFGRGRGRGMGRGFGAGRGPGGGHGPGAGRGADGDDHEQDAQFEADHDVFFFLLENRQKIDRKVTNLPNGIETVTESDDPEIATKIQEHVAAMYERVEKQQGIHMRDPLFREIFANANKIRMEMDDTPKGIWVKETSDDPYVARLLQEHAKTVNLFIKNGFREMPKNHPLPEREGKPAPADSASAACSDCQLNTFADFDRLYIPALALTKQEKAAPAAAAISRLSNRWEDLQQMLTECQDGWKEDLAAVTPVIATAQKLVADGQLLQAHEELEAIRDLFMALRDKHNVNYALDRLNRFHATMEQIVKPSMSMTDADVNDDVRKRFTELAAVAAEQWKDVEATQFDAIRFRLKGERSEQLNRLIQAEGKAVSRFQATLQAEPAEFLASARSLKPPFAKVFMFFGDFPKEVPSVASDVKPVAWQYPVVKNHGKVVRLPNAAEQPRSGTKLCVDVTAAGHAAQVNSAIEKVARFVNIYGGAGTEATKAEITVVLHGDATQVALNDKAYSTRFQTEENPNSRLIKDLKQNGVEFLVCGQALSHKGMELDEISDDVAVAVSALTVNANRARDGYVSIKLD